MKDIDEQMQKSRERIEGPGTMRTTVAIAALALLLGPHAPADRGLAPERGAWAGAQRPDRAARVPRLLDNGRSRHAGLNPLNAVAGRTPNGARPAAPGYCNCQVPRT